MVALVRAGVTATCSAADKPRYGDLSVDSNLPDTRFALGGPDENPFTAAVLAEADVACDDELKRQIDATGSARVWVPAAAPLIEHWVPGADLRGVRTLPVLILAGDLDAVVDELGHAEIVVTQRAFAAAEPFEARTVALLNRGVPSFAVEPDGTLHTSLMRSCTGWPSGTWIDPPRRTAPDGSGTSNCSTGHTHSTTHWSAAPVTGGPRESPPAPRSSTARCSRWSSTSDAAGGLPAWGSLLEIEPAGSVATRRAQGRRQSAGVGQRTQHRPGRWGHAAPGRDHRRRRRGHHPLRPARGLAAANLNLLEEPLPEQPSDLRLHGYQIATVSTQLNLPRMLRAEHQQLAPEAEAAQPLYARYWLHNRGPAPLGGLPAVAYLHPESIAGQPRYRSDRPAHRGQRLHRRGAARQGQTVCPPGWDGATRGSVLRAATRGASGNRCGAEHPGRAQPGLYPVRAELAVTGGGGPAAVVAAGGRGRLRRHDR